MLAPSHVILGNVRQAHLLQQRGTLLAQCYIVRCGIDQLRDRHHSIIPEPCFSVDIGDSCIEMNSQVPEILLYLKR